MSALDSLKRWAATVKKLVVIDYATNAANEISAVNVVLPDGSNQWFYIKGDN